MEVDDDGPGPPKVLVDLAKYFFQAIIICTLVLIGLTIFCIKRLSSKEKATEADENTAEEFTDAELVEEQIAQERFEKAVSQSVASAVRSSRHQFSNQGYSDEEEESEEIDPHLRHRHLIRDVKVRSLTEPSTLTQEEYTQQHTALKRIGTETTTKRFQSSSQHYHDYHDQSIYGQDHDLNSTYQHWPTSQHTQHDSSIQNHSDYHDQSTYGVGQESTTTSHNWPTSLGSQHDSSIQNHSDFRDLSTYGVGHESTATYQHWPASLQGQHESHITQIRQPEFLRPLDEALESTYSTQNSMAKYEPETFDGSQPWKSFVSQVDINKQQFFNSYQSNTYSNFTSSGFGNNEHDSNMDFDPRKWKARQAIVGAIGIRGSHYQPSPPTVQPQPPLPPVRISPPKPIEDFDVDDDSFAKAILDIKRASNDL